MARCFLPLAALLLLLLQLQAAQAQAQDLGGARAGAGAGQYAAAAAPPPHSCPAAKPGVWALVLILGMAAALEMGYIIHAEVSLRRASAWGYPTAPPLH